MDFLIKDSIGRPWILYEDYASVVASLNVQHHEKVIELEKKLADSKRWSDEKEWRWGELYKSWHVITGDKQGKIEQLEKELENLRSVYSAALDERNSYRSDAALYKRIMHEAALVRDDNQVAARESREWEKQANEWKELYRQLLDSTSKLYSEMAAMRHENRELSALKTSNFITTNTTKGY